MFLFQCSKYLTVSVNTRSLLPFIDEFIHQWLISQISIIFFLKNTSIKTSWYRNVSLCFFRSNFDWKCYTKCPQHDILNNTYGLEKIFIWGFKKLWFFNFCNVTEGYFFNMSNPHYDWSYGVWAIIPEQDFSRHLAFA